MSAARTLACVRQLPDRREEFALSGVDPSIRGEHVRAARAAESEQRDRVVLADEVLQHPAPLLGTLRVTGEVARQHECAADIGERLQARRLSGRRRRHRLVEPREAVVHAADGDLGEAELGECPQFEIRVTRGLRDCEGLLGEVR